MLGNPMRKSLFLAVMFLLFSFTSLLAQGRMEGTVLDSQTDEPLFGANVLFEGTSLGAATDYDGKFVIPNVPEGNYSLLIRYVGYTQKKLDVVIKSGMTVRETIKLDFQVIEGEVVTITAQAEGQIQAINQQLTSNTISNIVSQNRIKELPDVNAAESIGRLPGVSIERSGGEANKISIRGLEPKYNTVTVNGVRVPATGSDDRSVDLSLISSNMLDGITLKKANTPDMDADALGGTVDLKLKEAPVGLKAYGSLQGGYNQLQDYYGNYNITGGVSNRFFDNKLGVIANFNFDGYDRSADKFQGEYERRGVADDITLKPNRVRLRDESVKKSRAGASILLDYLLHNGKITANSFYNQLSSESLNRVNYMDIAHNSHYYDLEDRQGTTSIFTGAVGFEQNFDWINFDAAVSYTSSITDDPDNYTWGFVQENGAFNTTQILDGMDPHLVPEFQIIDTLITGFRNAFIYNTKREEKETALQFNVKMPFTLGSDLTGYIKLGGKFRWLDKMNDQEQFGRDNIQYGGTGFNNVIAPTLRYLNANYPEFWDWESDSTLAISNNAFPISRFLTNEEAPKFLNGEYNFGFMLDERLLRQFTQALRAVSEEYPDNWLRYSMGSDGYDYDGIEKYQSAYLMGEISYKNLVTLIPGFRYEKDYTEYNGQRFREVSSGGVQLEPADFTELRNVRESEFFLPMVHLTINPANWIKIRLAYTETLTRPDYNQYAPITTIDQYSGYVRANNAGLEPAKSTNYDAAIQIFENYTGFFTISGFYKSIDNLIFKTGYKLSPGIPLVEGLNVPLTWVKDTLSGRTTAQPFMDTYVNNPNPAIYKGFELEWQTNFWYLPSVFKGLILNINYTRIFSEVDKQIYLNRQSITGRPPRTTYAIVDTIRSGRMPYQPGHILNVTLGYDYKDFSVRFSYLYQADKSIYVDTYPELDQNSEAYERWDITVQQKLEWGIQLYANLANINKRKDQNQAGVSGIQPSYTEYYGFTMDVGLRFNL